MILHWQQNISAAVYSLEAKHPILVWIMKVKGPKNQADFIEVLYVVVNAWGPVFEIHGNIVRKLTILLKLFPSVLY